jgi:hypothetical protein
VVTGHVELLANEGATRGPEQREQDGKHRQLFEATRILSRSAEFIVSRLRKGCRIVGRNATVVESLVVFAALRLQRQREKGSLTVSPDADDQIVTRQARTASTFVEIADTLVDDFDVIDVLSVLSSRCVELLGAAAAGILLADTHGNLRVMAASTEQTRLLELFQLQNDQGPCLECFKTGAIVVSSDLTLGSPWPTFAAESIRAGFPSVCAIPLRLRSTVLGCLNLFMFEPQPLSADDVALAQALADVASIAIMQDQSARDAALRERNLQHALNSRISIEQAKGMIAERGRVDMDTAFSCLRAYARNHNRGLTELAESLVAGRTSIDAVSSGSRPAAGSVPRPTLPS